MNHIARIDMVANLGMGFSGLNTAVPYDQKILDMFGARLIGDWWMAEAAGTDALDASGNARKGTYSGPTLGQTGIGDGKTCPLFDGINDYVSLPAAFNSAFNGAEFGVGIWFKIINAAEWAAADNRKLFLFTNGSSQVSIRKYQNGILWNYSAGGVQLQYALAGQSTVDWSFVGMSVSKTADEARCYQDNELKQTLTGLGTWGAAPSYSVIGQDGYFAGQNWAGWLAKAFVLNGPATTAEFARAATIPF